MIIWTDAINAHGYFDARYTCDIDNSSPELRWKDPPHHTVGYVLIAEDLDAEDPQGGVFAHWIVYNIPANVLHLPAGIPPQDMLPNGIRQGVNSYGKLGYWGPCPPRGGQPHRYVFRLYALSAFPELSPRLTRQKLLSTIHPHILVMAEISGLYRRAIERAG